jgi:hypothetical protein
MLEHRNIDKRLYLNAPTINTKKPHVKACKGKPHVHNSWPPTYFT